MVAKARESTWIRLKRFKQFRALKQDSNHMIGMPLFFQTIQILQQIENIEVANRE